jgi:hypothetical protein
MAHDVGSPDCDEKLEMVVSFAGRPPEAERERELALGGPVVDERVDPASRPSQDSA